MALLDIGQIGTVFGIMAILVTTFFQIRSYKKDQREQAEKNRAAISTEIKANGLDILEKVQYKFDSLISATKISRDDLEALKKELAQLKAFVDRMDREGTTEWTKVKPFITDKIDYLEKRIDELERRLIK